MHKPHSFQDELRTACIKRHFCLHATRSKSCFMSAMNVRYEGARCISSPKQRWMPEQLRLLLGKQLPPSDQFKWPLEAPACTHLVHSGLRLAASSRALLIVVCTCAGQAISGSSTSVNTVALPSLSSQTRKPLRCGSITTAAASLPP